MLDPCIINRFLVNDVFLLLFVNFRCHQMMLIRSFEQGMETINRANIDPDTMIASREHSMFSYGGALNSLLNLVSAESIGMRLDCRFCIPAWPPN